MFKVTYQTLHRNNCLNSECFSCAVFHFPFLIGDLNVCLVSSRVVVDPFQLQVAIALAVASRSSGQMKTKSIFAEILYCMSPSTSIIDSFKKFGVSERDSTLIAIIFDKGENIEDLIKGSSTNFTANGTTKKEIIRTLKFNILDTHLCMIASR